MAISQRARRIFSRARFCFGTGGVFILCGVILLSGCGRHEPPADVTIINGNITEKIVEYFACSIEPETQRLLSEDYHFCRVARLNGYKIYAAPWVTLGHFGTYLFEGGLVPAP